MTKTNKINIGTGLAFFVYGVLFLAGGIIVAKPGKSGDYGPGFLPIVIGCLTIFLSGALLFTTWWGMRKKMTEQKTTEIFPPHYKSIIFSIILMIAYMAALQPLGFVISSSVYCVLQMIIMSSKKTTRKRLAFYAIISIGLMVGINYIFVNLFDLMLPAGVLG